MNKKRIKMIFTISAILILIVSVSFNVYSIIKLKDNAKTIEIKSKTKKSVKKENTKLKKNIETLEKEQEENVNSTSSNTNKTIYKEKILVLNTFLNDMKNDIKNKINNEGYKTYIETCEGQLPDHTVTHQYEMSSDVIDKIVTKLEKAKKVESDITASFFCAKYSLETYKTKNNNIFSLYQANNEKILIVGYNYKGYAFTFDEDVSTFIKDLLKK